MGPDTCVGNGETTFDQFIAELKENRTVEDWGFQPRQLTAKQSDTIVAFNACGEVHSLTEVQRFGGGIVPMLNVLSRNPVPAPGYGTGR